MSELNVGIEGRSRLSKSIIEVDYRSSMFDLNVKCRNGMSKSTVEIDCRS